MIYVIYDWIRHDNCYLAIWLECDGIWIDSPWTSPCEIEYMSTQGVFGTDEPGSICFHVRARKLDVLIRGIGSSDTWTIFLNQRIYK